jgi:hypothetical protein
MRPGVVIKGLLDSIAGGMSSGVSVSSMGHCGVEVKMLYHELRVKIVIPCVLRSQCRQSCPRYPHHLLTMEPIYLDRGLRTDTESQAC